MKIMIILGFALMFLPTIGHSAKCSNVNISITNNSSSDIRVKDMQYYDYNDAKWRNESTSNIDIDKSGVTKSLSGGSKDLEYIGGSAYKVKILFCELDGSHNCDGGDKCAEFQKDSKCTDNNETYKAVLTDSTVKSDC